MVGVGEDAETEAVATSVADYGGGAVGETRACFSFCSATEAKDSNDVGFNSGDDRKTDMKEWRTAAF